MITVEYDRTWWARLLSTCFTPPLLPVVTGAAVGWHLTRPHPYGLLWGLGGSGSWALLCAALATTGTRMGWWPSPVPSQRGQRLLLLGMSLIAAAAVWLVCGHLGAPPALMALGRTALLLTTLVLVCTSASNVSLHTSSAAASITLVTLQVHVWGAVLYPLVAAIAWSRLHLRVHTPAQVLLGAGLGTAVCTATVYLPL
ncbi:phosphatase PAP2 family protein [Streptomyces sp. M92]|uniref:phosphatase PAP2 family protein n=1 Tax=Streptomyces sp. M92 TaxID=2944250 RepID=UPI00234989FE|nr:phosphatase PAP2 family protein [Streptomyces sp. M92]WCN05264.1 phosphatase PAP2 family protein [Streptomyces sp. M92]